MSTSRFVSAGTVDRPSDKEDAWKKAQEAVEATKRQKEDAVAGSGLQEGGKTLYEVLQANKAAKQEAFEESLRLKTQAQFLNEEDAEYLESLSKNERAQKAASEKRAREQLEEFRKQQEVAERQALASSQFGTLPIETEAWSISAKKRRRGKEQDFIKGVKLRKTSTSHEKEAEAGSKAVVSKPGSDMTAAAVPEKKELKDTKAPSQQGRGGSPAQENPAPILLGLGLSAYSSDEDD
ncbi:uncharacterized protein PV09_02585 [Verruconis gallopava]|uniref:FAM192A/Fyv6 N-terminal domain-containing protein n=1 Tax=Verruconis gallopava TaxID=253628 RepID=A0A0D1XVX2_9PEZI|nr:uncharacterized protein PV09_02585 [Verruconis gallopava]KIW06916.1 hypothetical protein PV09_02585 [Verruconis gallopava]